MKNGISWDRSNNAVAVFTSKKVRHQEGINKNNLWKNSDQSSQRLAFEKPYNPVWKRFNENLCRSMKIINKSINSLKFHKNVT